MGIYSNAMDSSVPTGIPVVEATMPAENKASLASSTQQAVMAKHGVPTGLANEMVKNVASFPQRIWIVDDSCSMQSGDGAMMSFGQMIKCTRAKELAQTVLVQAELAHALGASIEFQTLNGPCHSVDSSNSNEQLAAVREYYDRRGGHPLLGSTPLTEAVNKVIAKISPMVDSLRADGKRALVVLATDGLPNDSTSFLESMKKLQQLPCHVQIRLCTSDEGITQYWNELDKELERPLDVLDDVAGEAEECAKVNAWLQTSAVLEGETVGTRACKLCE